MAGTCIATVKVIGISSLGLLTSSLAYQCWRTIPYLIGELNLRVGSMSNSHILESIRGTVVSTKIGSVSLGGMASALLALSFFGSPPSGKHPYLIYSAVGALASVFSVYWMGSADEKRLLYRSTNCRASGNEKTASASASAAAAADAAAAAADVGAITSSSTADSSTKDKHSSDNEKSDDSQLGKSYIHVSDEDSSVISTPTVSVPNSPRATSIESLQYELSVEEEVDNALYRKETSNELKNIRSSYIWGSSIAAFSFLLGVIGLSGEYC